METRTTEDYCERGEFEGGDEKRKCRSFFPWDKKYVSRCACTDKVLIAEFKFDYLQHADLIETLNKKGITHAHTAMMTPAVSSWLTEVTNQIIPVKSTPMATFGQ